MMNTARETADTVRTLAISEIIRDGDTLQVREEVDPKTVEQYARTMRAGVQFPPIKVYKVEGRYFLVDGFHRVEAAEAVAEAKKQLSPKIKAEVIEGTIAQAQRAAALANTAHGKPLTKADHRRSVRMLAQSGALDGMNARAIADLMNNVVSHVTVITWAKKDFAGLISERPKKGERSPVGSRERDPLSATQVEHQAALSGLSQALRLLQKGKITDGIILDRVAEMAEEVRDAAVSQGGDAERARTAYGF